MLGLILYTRPPVRLSASSAGPAGNGSPSIFPTRSIACPAFRSSEPAFFSAVNTFSASGRTKTASVVPPETWNARNGRSNSSVLRALQSTAAMCPA